MALSTKHRLALYEHFRPQVGDEVTEALLAEFPARDGDELVTKDFLRAELAEFAVVRKEIAELRAEMHGMSAGFSKRLTTVAFAFAGLMLTGFGTITTLLIART